MPGPSRTRRPLIALVVLLLILVIGYAVNVLGGDDSSGSGGRSTGASVSASRTSVPSSSSPSGPTTAKSVALSSLPTQARTTYRLIRSDGPFPYSQDGVVFGNLERHLPIKARGYYREYTVKTPGESDRGARRIITGNGGEVYYTADHYDSFVRVDPDR